MLTARLGPLTIIDVIISNPLIFRKDSLVAAVSENVYPLFSY